MPPVRYGSRLAQREFSSAGRASALQAEGQRFDPVNSHRSRGVAVSYTHLDVYKRQSQDMYGSIDLVVDKIERQIRKNKTKIARKHREKVPTGEVFSADFNLSLIHICALMSRPKLLLLDEPSMGLLQSLFRKFLILSKILRHKGLPFF